MAAVNNLQISSRIAALREKLDQLRLLDRHFIVHGASKHRYVSHPLQEAEVLILEEQLAVRLPEDFRQFLIEIGHGAGPHYGVLEPDEITGELNFWRDYESETEDSVNCQQGAPSLPFPVTLSQAAAAIRNLPTYGPYIPLPSAPNGVIPINTHGCTYWSLLVTCGELTGSVFNYDEGSDAVPAIWNHREDCDALATEIAGGLFQLPRFLDWYEGWLDVSITKLLSGIDGRPITSKDLSNQPTDPRSPDAPEAYPVSTPRVSRHRPSPLQSNFLLLLAIIAPLVICIRNCSRYSQTPAATPTDNLSIEGSPSFTNKIENALALLKERSPDDLKIVQTHVRRIREHDHSGMNMFADVPTIELAAPTYDASVTWCASVLVHESWHMKLYRENRDPRHWSGTLAERACNEVQLAALKKIAAPQHEIDHLTAQDGTHWDVNGDGVYDWRDFKDRNW